MDDQPETSKLRAHRDGDDQLDREDEAYLRFRRESVVRVLDAAIAMVSATNELVVAAEELLRDQRARLVSDERRESGDSERRPNRREKIRVSDEHQTESSPIEED